MVNILKKNKKEYQFITEANGFINTTKSNLIKNASQIPDETFITTEDAGYKLIIKKINNDFYVYVTVSETINQWSGNIDVYTCFELFKTLFLSSTQFKANIFEEHSCQHCISCKFELRFAGMTIKNVLTSLKDRLKEIQQSISILDKECEQYIQWRLGLVKTIDPNLLKK